MARTTTFLRLLVLLASLLVGGLSGAIDPVSGDGSLAVVPPKSSEPTVPSDVPGFVTTRDGTTPNRLAQEPPRKARELLQAIQDRQGDPLPGYVGGRTFQNREQKLPRGQYREYDVNPKVPGRSRGAERIVIEQRTGKAYYTQDHYRTFVPLN